MQKFCVICHHNINSDVECDFGYVRGNSEKYINKMFHLWRCPQCKSIMALDNLSLKDIYSQYALDMRTLDNFAISTYANLLKRLKKVGLKKHHTLLDYGCGVGTFLQYLKSQGYTKCVGYDPFRSEYAVIDPSAQFDFVVANDVIEHTENPRDFLRQCSAHVLPGGILYVGTADSDGVEMTNLERHRMRLHQPYHRVLINQDVLNSLVQELPNMQTRICYRRSYLDTLKPFANYRFLDELSRGLDHNLNRMFSSESIWTVLMSPRIFFYGLFGYFFPSSAEPAVILSKNRVDDKLKNKIWDYIIVGTGMGGGAFGYKMSQAGHSVLFLEGGRSPLRPTAKLDKYAEADFGVIPPSEALANSGRYTKYMHFHKSKSIAKKYSPFIGSGVGGSSALYGMILERFSEKAFLSWPVKYKDLQTHYDFAEKLLQVPQHSTIAHPGNIMLADHFTQLGYNVSPLRLAHDSNPKCTACQGFLCGQKCKNDSLKCFINPALDSGAHLLDECEVTSLIMSQDSAQGVNSICDGDHMQIYGHNVVVAAGALRSPCLLLRSKNEYWPQGVGNQNDLVGRYLMRHLMDIYALRVDTSPHRFETKELSFHICDSTTQQELCVVQSFGRLPPARIIFNDLARPLYDLQLALVNWLMPLVRWPIEQLIHMVVRNRLALASIIEDSPHHENRVWIDGDQIHVKYTVQAEEKKQVQQVRQILKKIFSPLGCLFLALADKDKMLAHVCGTCRMGDDPKSSVVSARGLVHGTKNLYVVDASVFPTSGPTNPALTIAANALRMASDISKQ